MKVFLNRFFKNNYAVLILFFLVLIVAIANLSPNTWLSGWDNLHPEFNFSLNFKRSIFSVWQEYQGLGLLGGMGHASDLFREVLLWIFSLIISLRYLRYFFHFSMLLVGTLGVYYLLKGFILENSKKEARILASLAGAIFYIFNLGTLQMFYIPWEAFSTHFALLPWLFWVVFRYLKEPSKKNLLIFLLINLLSVSQGYVATVFLVYLLALTLALLFHFVFVRHDFKKILIIYFLTFCLNAFWLVPNLYFVATAADANTGAKINLMSTEDVFLKNKKYGDITSTMILKGFWFDNIETDVSGVPDYLMGDWVNHLKNPLFAGIGYFLFGISFLGILLAIVKKNKTALLFLPVFLFSLTILTSNTFPFSFLTKFIYKIPLFSQMFRFPFTKFSILTAICLAIFYALTIVFLVSLKGKQFLRYSSVIFLIVLPVIFLYPVFQGKLFYAKERAKIPEEYFQVFDFFKKQDKNTRIANFPQPTFWGWTNYKWGYYSGSGFLWYGIQQPILDRAFDPWSGFNENYYWEISYALYSKNREFFERVLEKYQVSWLLVDGNVINPSSSKALFLDELEEVLSSQQSALSSQRKFELAAEFGKIKIYKVNLETTVRDFVWMGSNLPVANSYQWGNVDVAYEEVGNYISDSSVERKAQSEEPKLKAQNFNDSQKVGNQLPITPDVYYPFRSLFTGRTTNDLDFEIEDRGDKFVFKKSLPKEVENYNLAIPQYKGDELVEVDKTDLTKVRYFIPTVEVRDGEIEVVIPKVSGLFSAEIDPTKVEEVSQAKNCNQFGNGKVQNAIRPLRSEASKAQNGDFLTLEAEDANNCSASFWLPDLPHKYGYLISAETKNISGKPLLFWVENLTNRKADQELYLDSTRRPLAGTNYLIQPPMAEDGLGYSLHFDNISIGRKQTINDLGKISVNLIPYEFLMGLKMVGESGGVNVSNLEGVIASHLEVNHPNPAIYEVRIKEEVAENTTLVLSQAYHEGWKAYMFSSKFKVQSSKLLGFFPFIFGEEIKEHVKVNNWENGWLLKNPNHQSLITNYTIYLVFWPQYLEYTGFAILGITIAILLYCYIAGERKNKITS